MNEKAKLVITATEGQCKVEVKGSDFDIFYLGLLSIRSLYRSLAEDNEDVAEKFKDFILTEGKWIFATDEELREENKRMLSEKVQDITGLKDLLNDLDDLLNKLKED